MFFLNLKGRKKKEIANFKHSKDLTISAWFYVAVAASDLPIAPIGEFCDSSVTGAKGCIALGWDQTQHRFPNPPHSQVILANLAFLAILNNCLLFTRQSSLFGHFKQLPVVHPSICLLR